MTFQTQATDPRLDTPEKRQAVAARLDQPGWRPRTLDERKRNQALRQAVLEGWCYIPTAAEARRGNRQVLAEIDASRVRVKPAAVLAE